MNTENIKKLIKSGHASLMNSRTPTGEKTTSLFLRSGIIIELSEEQIEEVYPKTKK